MKRLLALALATTICQTAMAADDLLAYAKQWAGKYPSINAPAPKRFTGRFQFSPLSGVFLTSYRDGFVSVEYPRNHAELRQPVILRKCRSTGDYIGANAFNAKVRVAKQWCESVQLRGPDQKLAMGAQYDTVWGLKFRGKPEDERKLFLATSIDVELDIETTAPADDDFVSVKETYTSAPTLTEPFDVSGVQYNVYGHVIAARFYAPRSATPFATLYPQARYGELGEDP